MSDEFRRVVPAKRTSENVSPDKFRRALRTGKASKKSKPPSPDEVEAINTDNAIHEVAKRALRAAGYEPNDGYVVMRSKTLEPLYVVVPSGLVRP